MTLNAKQCHILTISHERNPLIANYTLGQEQLSVVDSYPYLGVTISSGLRWHKHVDSVSAKHEARLAEIPPSHKQVHCYVGGIFTGHNTARSTSILPV